MAYKNQPTVGNISLPAGPAFSTPSKAMKAGGASAANIKKVQKQEIGKPLSKGMQQWVEANRSKLKNPTKKQDAIFKKYDQMKKAGMLAAKPAKQSNKTSAGQSRVTKPVTGATPTRNPNAQSAARKTASAMRSEVTKRQSQKVTDAMMRDANKPKPKSKTTEKPQSSKSGGRKASKDVKQKQNPAVRKFLKNLADQFKTFGTYKEDQKVSVGNIDFISDGKGGVRGARRRQF